MDTNFFKADRRIRSRSDRRIIRVNLSSLMLGSAVSLRMLSALSRQAVCPLVVLLIISLLVAPVMAQQDGAPELTDEATRAIDKGLNYLLSVQRKDGPTATSAR